MSANFVLFITAPRNNRLNKPLLFSELGLLNKAPSLEVSVPNLRFASNSNRFALHVLGALYYDPCLFGIVTF